MPFKTPDYYYIIIESDRPSVLDAIRAMYQPQCPHLDFDAPDGDYLHIIGDLEHLVRFTVLTHNQYPIINGYNKDG